MLDDLQVFKNRLSNYETLIYYVTIAMLSGVLQKLSILKLKENSEADLFVIITNSLLFITGVIFIVKVGGK